MEPGGRHADREQCSPAQRAAPTQFHRPRGADLDRTDTLAAIVARHPASARVFQSHRLDFCCHGDVTLDEALRGRPESAEAILGEVEEAVRSLDREVATEDVTALSVAALDLPDHRAPPRLPAPAAAAIEPLLAKVARSTASTTRSWPRCSPPSAAARRDRAPPGRGGAGPLPAPHDARPDRAAVAAGLGRMYERPPRGRQADRPPARADRRLRDAGVGLPQLPAPDERAGGPRDRPPPPRPPREPRPDAALRRRR